MSYTPLETIQYFIREQEAILESISHEIREETNYDDEHHHIVMSQLSEEYDDTKSHLENLLVVKQMLSLSELSTRSDNDAVDGS
jgi:translation initiation factor 2 beta subunit (eIF-2beta)/eIF-5